LLPGAAAAAGGGGGSSYQLYQPPAAGQVIQFVDPVTGATMSLPAPHHAPSSSHLPLSSFAAASQLDLPVRQSAAGFLTRHTSACSF